MAQTEEAIREVGWITAELGRVKCRKVLTIIRYGMENSIARRSAAYRSPCSGANPIVAHNVGPFESQKSVMSKSRQARGLRLPKLYHNFVEIDWKEPQPDLTLYSVPRAFRRDILERFCDDRRASHLRKDA